MALAEWPSSKLRPVALLPPSPCVDVLVGIIDMYRCLGSEANQRGCPAAETTLTTMLRRRFLPPQVEISSKEIAKLIGKLFILKSAVNLLSSVMDTPDFFCEFKSEFESAVSAVSLLYCKCAVLPTCRSPWAAFTDLNYLSA